MVSMKAVFDKIIEYDSLPKFQVERALSPIISLYISDMLSFWTKKRIELVTPEFPLMKENDGAKSTNIDYLLADRAENTLYLVELKTDRRGRLTDLDDQVRRYRRIVDRIGKKNSSFLYEDLKKIAEKSKKSDKYQYLLDKVDDFKDLIRSCKTARLVYLIPARQKNYLLGTKNMLTPDECHAFGEVPELNGGDEVFSLLRKALLELDELPPKR